MSRGRKSGQEISEPTRGYITITDKLRVRVEADCLTVEEKIGEKDGEINYGNYKYLTSWDNLLNHLVKRFTAEKISKKSICSFEEARVEIKTAIRELKITLLGEIDRELLNGKQEIKDLINKFNI
jgi:hypothetical protein